MKALRLPTPHLGRFWFATGFRAVLRGSCSPKRSRADGGAARAWAVWSAGGPVPAGVRVDGVGSQRFPGDPSRAFARLEDPGRISGPSPTRSHPCCPRAQHDEGFSGHMISRLRQGFGTRCLRFASGVAAARARLASGWLVSLCREGVEPSGSLRKISERSHVILLSRAYPVASWGACSPASPRCWCGWRWPTRWPASSGLCWRTVACIELRLRRCRRRHDREAVRSGRVTGEGWRYGQETGSGKPALRHVWTPLWEQEKSSRAVWHVVGC